MDAGEAPPARGMAHARGTPMGVVAGGIGGVGSRVSERLTRLGLTILACGSMALAASVGDAAGCPPGAGQVLVPAGAFRCAGPASDE